MGMLHRTICPGKSTTTQTPRPTIEGTPARTSAGISVANLGVGGLQQSHVMLGRRNVGTSRQPHDLRSELDEADLGRHALKTLQGIVDVLHERRSVWRIRQGIGAVDVLDVRMPRHPRPPPSCKHKTQPTERQPQREQPLQQKQETEGVSNKNSMTNFGIEIGIRKFLLCALLCDVAW